MLAGLPGFRTKDHPLASVENGRNDERRCKLTMTYALVGLVQYDLAAESKSAKQQDERQRDYDVDSMLPHKDIGSLTSCARQSATANIGIGFWGSQVSRSSQEYVRRTGEAAVICTVNDSVLTSS